MGEESASYISMLMWDIPEKVTCLHITFVPVISMGEQTPNLREMRSQKDRLSSALREDWHMRKLSVSFFGRLTNGL